MAYMGRGGFSSFGRGGASGGISTDNNSEDTKNQGMYNRYRFFRMYYYVPLNNTYVRMQIIAALVILVISGIIFLTVYKPLIDDPIESMKKTILNVYIFGVLFLLVLTFLANSFSKNKSQLIKSLIAVLSVSIITILVFAGIKVNMDATYTKEKFEQIYVQKYGEEGTKKESKVKVSLSELKIKDEKEYYVDECKNAYNIFSYRMYGITLLNVLLIALLLYQISKVYKIQKKKEKLNKNDEILFDEEENVKY